MKKKKLKSNNFVNKNKKKIRKKQLGIDPIVVTCAQPHSVENLILTFISVRIPVNDRLNVKFVSSDSLRGQR